MSPTLTVVATDHPAEPVAQRIRRLQAEASALADNQVSTLANLLLDAAELAAEIAGGGEAYQPGARDVARQLVDELETRAQTLNAIRARADR